MKDPLAFKIYFLLKTGILKKTQKNILKKDILYLSQPHTSNAKLRVSALTFDFRLALGYDCEGCENESGDDIADGHIHSLPRPK